MQIVFSGNLFCKNNLFIVLIMLLFFFLPLSAQIPQWQVYDISNTGLPGLKISALDIDLSGRFWVGTVDGGLGSFANKRWKNYNTNNSPLPSDHITALATAQDNSIWIGTNGDGVAHLTNNQWELFNTANSGLSNNAIKAITIDTDDRIWIATEGGGISVYDGNDWTVYNTSNSGLPGNIINAIKFAGNGDAWVGVNGGGLALFDGATWNILDANNSGLPDNYVTAIGFEDDGTAWIGTRFSGAASLQNGNWTVFNTSNSGMPSNQVSVIAIDATGQKYIGTVEGGVTRYNDLSWTLYQTTLIFGNSISAISIDANDVAWFTTNGSPGIGALAGFNGAEWEVFTLFNTGLPTNLIHSIAFEPDGTPWIGTPGIGFGGLASFVNDEWTVFNIDSSGFPVNGIADIEIDADGNKWVSPGAVISSLWYGTKGVARFDGNNWTIYNTSNSGLPENEVTDIAIAPDGSKWFSTFSTVSKLENDSIWANYENIGLFVSSLDIDTNNNVWVTSLGSGLAKFDGTTWETFNTNNSGIPTNILYTVTADDNGSVWIGSVQHGLIKFDGQQWEVYNTSNSGLPDNSVTSIAIEENGVKWIGTRDGMASFDGTNWIGYYTGNSGLPDREIATIRIDENGNKWIGTGGNGDGGGLAIFNESGIVAIPDPISSETPTFKLSQNYPNPFNPETTLEFEITKSSLVTVVIYDILGRRVTTLLNQQLPAGQHQVRWDGRNYNGQPVASGQYFYQIQSGRTIATRKMLLVR